MKNNIIRCHKCEAVNIDTGDEIECRRCNKKIYKNKQYSLNSTIAYLITAMIAFVPANLYPMLIITQFGITTQSNIIEGIIEIYESGSYSIALIILFASVFVPIIKFILLIYLIIATKLNTHKDPHIRHRIFYITVIGPWSMIDVFVVAILVSLVHLDNIEIIAGEASTAFSIMVFFTLLSALSFDSRSMD
ncbi:Paraquat-inducible protein A [hydrothermal vent metagenome]|uniref:Paraquat-inducible protein A n=1 Tax=hydrothermal vent metagenome TaxID=652676 RepID=A0A1W1EIN2_9ZZZZ